MTYGVVPSFAAFEKHIRSIDPDEGRPYLASGQKYPIEAHANSADGQVLQKLIARGAGVGGYGRLKYELTDKQLYGLIRKLAAAWNRNGNEDAGSLASSIMTTLGYEWI